MAENKELSFDDVRKNAAFMMATEISEDGSEWRDLQCPKCKCDKIQCDSPDLGQSARCYECGYEFTITENCWVLLNEND